MYFIHICIYMHFTFIYLYRYISLYIMYNRLSAQPDRLHVYLLCHFIPSVQHIDARNIWQMNKNMCYRKRLESLYVKILTMVISVAAQEITGPKKALCILIFFSNEAKLRQNKHPEQVSRQKTMSKRGLCRQQGQPRSLGERYFRGRIGRSFFVFQLFGGSAVGIWR